MIQTSFFPQPEKDKPIKIIQIDPSGLQPKKVEELVPDHDILLDTYMIYPTGGYHPFYGVPNTFPRYQLPIWPCIRRIKFSKCYNSQEARDRTRRGSQKEHQTIEQLNPFLVGNYYKINLKQNRNYISHSYTQIRKNGEFGKNKVSCQSTKFFHRLVALAFIPNPKKYKLVLHVNDDTTNYLIENLKWGTQRHNMKGKIKRRPDTMEQKYLNMVSQGFIKG